jgi:hypothetical protein
MRMSMMIAPRQWWLGFLLLLVGGSAMVPVHVEAQNQGQNAVFNASSTTNTSAFIDAANFSSTGDICAKLHSVLNSTSMYIQETNWQVIDARGIVPTTGSTQACSSTDSNPWASLSTPRRNWVTILLPAGTIQISSTWTLPSYTRIIGEGPGLTTLQAGSSFSGPMIQMGCLATTCALSFGISVENLTLDAQSQTIDGIDNNDAEELSYVKHVQMINIGKTGLSVGFDSTYAPGPNHSTYSDISITETSSGAACIKIAQAGNYPVAPKPVQPRGIHGINCTSSANSNAGIYLDGSNVSLEDIYVNGFADGIQIGGQSGYQGSSGGVSSDVIFNVTGGNGLTNVVHICGSNHGSNTACPQTNNTVSDLTLMGITSEANNTIQDDVTDTLLPESTDPTVGMYILGESVSVGSNTGYSRFTTSPSIPTWRVGTDDPPTGNCAVGTLYSRTSTTTSSTSPPTIWGCVGSSTWSSIK